MICSFLLLCLLFYIVTSKAGVDPQIVIIENRGFASCTSKVSVLLLGITNQTESGKNTCVHSVCSEQVNALSSNDKKGISVDNHKNVTCKSSALDFSDVNVVKSVEFVACETADHLYSMW